MAAGLRAGIDEVVQHLDPHGVNRVVLLGDGVPNDEGPIRALAESAGHQGVTVTALGLGPDYNETLMGAVAQLSGGRFHYVEKSDQVAETFKNEVLRLQSVYARNATLELTPGPGVRIEAVVGQPMARSGNGVRVSVGDMSRDETRDLIVRLTTDPHHDGAPVELLDAVLSFDDALGSGTRAERRLFFGARATSKDAELEAGRVREVEDAAAIIQAAAATVDAIQKAREGHPGDAQSALGRAAEDAETQARKTSNAELARKATSMRDLQRALPSSSTAPTPAPAAVRSAHDQAMKNLQ
jgi:Ca-activated chloride channel family protein